MMPLSITSTGIIEVYTALGIFGGTVLFGAMFLLVAQLFRRGARDAGAMALYRAVVLGIFLQLPFGTQHVGEAGISAWICLGLGLAALVQPRPAPPMSRRPAP